MKSGKIVVALVLVTALLLTLASVNAAVEEVVWKYEGYFEDYIAVEVTAPAQASRGDTITIEVKVTAKEDLEDVVVDVRIAGTTEEGTDAWKSKWETDVIDVSSLDDGDKEDGDCDVDIPDDADSGLICGEIHCEFYSVADDEAYEFDTAFPMTYLLGAITEEEYEALQSELATAKSERDAARSELATAKSERDAARSELATAKSELETAKSERDKWKDDYDSLKTNYDSLKSNNDALQAKYTDLESEYKITADKLSDFTTYVYILIGSTILFLATTIIFAVRKRGAV